MLRKLNYAHPKQQKNLNKIIYHYINQNVILFEPLTAKILIKSSAFNQKFTIKTIIED